MITIDLLHNMQIEPGHQEILLPYNEEGQALARLLTGDDFIWRYYDGTVIRIPHDATVDARIVKLVDLLADIRYKAPDMLQLTLLEMQE